MPQILGSDYGMLVIVVPVLLIAVIGLLLLRKRQKARSAGKFPGETLVKGSRADRSAAKAAAKAEKAAIRPGKPTSESRKAAALAARAERDASEATEATHYAVEAAAGDAAGAESGLAAIAHAEAGAPAQSGAGALTPEAKAFDAAVAAAAAQPGAVPPAAPPPPEPAPADRAERQKMSKDARPSPGPTAALAKDPLQTVLASILQGWGDLTTEDTNRLDVFRRDRVIAAILAAELPKDMKGSEYAKTRLTQLRRYASFLEQAERTPPPQPEAHEFAGMAIGGPPVTAGVSAGTPAAAAAPAIALAGATTTSAGQPTAAEPAVIRPAVSQPAQTPSGQTRSWYAPKEEDDLAPPPAPVAKTPPQPRDWTTTPTGEPEVEAGASEERAAEFDWGAPTDEAAHQTELKALDLTWNHELPGNTDAALPIEAPRLPEAALPIEALWPAEPALPVESPWPAEPFQPATTEKGAESGAQATDAAPSWGSGNEASRSAEAAVAAAAAAFWNTPDAVRLEQASGAYGKQVSNAADIMALPAEDRPDMLAFLEPGELAKVFQLTEDKDLKKAVIDTLEHVGNTASLDAIHLSLEDSDPEIQLYALDAADRMLGKAT